MSSFKEMITQIDNGLQPDKSFDIIKRELTIAERPAVMYFIDGMTKDEIYEKMFEFFFKQTPEDLKSVSDMKEFAKIKMPYVEVNSSNDIDFIKNSILSGPSALIIEGIEGALIIDTRTYPMRGVEEPQKDKSLRGSRDGFVETLVMNTALIRRRIRDERLRMEYMQIGTSTKLDIAICFIDGKADKKILDIIRQKFKNIDIGGISMTQQALSEKLQKSSFFNPYPKFKFTERPDYASACVLDGRIAVIMDNSPTVMLIPVSLSDFLRETDDYYFLPFTCSYNRTIRLIVALANVLLTPLYLLLVNNPHYIPEWLDFLKPTVSSAIPLLAQFLILEFLVDALKMASLNTPDSLSNSLGIIGGLLLSEFAVNAGWFIIEAILFMAFITIASFSLPSFEFGYAMKFERIMLLILTQIFDVWGFAAGIVIIIISKFSIKTLSGRNYLFPIVPFNAKAFSEMFLRFPLK